MATLDGKELVTGQKPARMTIDGAPGPADAQALRHAALAAAKTSGDVTIDCAKAEHLHAAVLQVLLCLRREIEPAGRRLVLINVSPAVQKFLEVGGVSKLLQVEAAR
jgi:anti-anti-sigma factor